MLNGNLETGDSVNVNLGEVVEREDIKSSMRPFRVFPEARVVYPDKVLKALGDLYMEYNQNFTSLVEINREWPADYQYCMFGPGGTPINFVVQIDMVGLSKEFLSKAEDLPVDELKEVLRRQIFEIENSVAMYQLLENAFSNGRDSFFKVQFRKSLDEMRRRLGRPIALLAVTSEKFTAMKEIEFGKENGEALSDEEVFNLSGFDKFFGPDEFRQHIKTHGNSQYLLYVRSSDPVAKLKKPGLEIEHPLLGDPEMRRIIKENSLTLNVDSPRMEPYRMINDTKDYQPPMQMSFPVDDETDLYSPGFKKHLSSGKTFFDKYEGQKLSDQFVSYLNSCGVDPRDVESGAANLWAKPIKCSYGCYGHVCGPLTSGKKFRGELRRNIRQRGRYVVQVEMKVPRLTNSTNGKTYNYIDRNFLAFTNGKPRFLGGFRSFMPVNSHEAKKKRNHGNHLTVLGEIVS